jgi:hypothetical protein
MWAMSRPPSPRKPMASTLPAVALNRIGTTWTARQLSTDGADTSLTGPSTNMLFIEFSIMLSSGEMSGVEDREVGLWHLHIQHGIVGF